MSTISVIAKKVSKCQIEGKVTKLISVLFIALNFAMNMRPVILKHTEVVRMIAARGFRSLTDLEILARLANSVSVVSVISTFVRFAIGSKLFCRACVSAIQELLYRFGGQTDIQEMFVTIVRRLFVFIPLAFARRKYRARSLLICESLAALARCGLSWLQHTVTLIASGIGTRVVPSYFGVFFQLAPSVADERCLHDLALFTSCQPDLKTFPFDRMRGVLVNPPANETVTPRLATSRRKSSSKGSSNKKKKRKTIEQSRNRPLTGRAMHRLEDN
jgi:hypothetical protein